jgi:acetyl esterase/lipase
MAAARRLPCDPLHCCTWILTAAMSVVLARDVVGVARATGVWKRLYTPVAAAWMVPVVVYFHGGGFCVGSATSSSWPRSLRGRPAL